MFKSDIFAKEWIISMFTKGSRWLLFLLLIVLLMGLTASAQADPVFIITVNTDPTVLSVGQSKKIDFSLTANSEVTNTTLTFTSDNTGVAVAHTDGTIDGKAVGLANVTIQSVAYPKIKVVAKVEVTSSSTIELNVTSITLAKGKTFTLTPIITPDAAKPATYSTSDASICTVNSATGEVTAVSPGIATIIAANAHGVKAYCTVTVPGSAVTPTPTPTPTPTGSAVTPTPTPMTGIPAFVNTVKGSLNLRAGMSTSATILRTIPENAPFTVLQYGGTWCKAFYNGTVGYVMTQFVRLAGTVPTGIPYVTPTPTPIPTGSPYVVQFQARVATPSGSLNLRTNPWQGAPRILLIPRNAIVDVLQYDASWSFVRYGSFEGYVMSKFLSLDITPAPSPVTPTTPPYTTTAQVVTLSGGLNMRKSPSSGAKRITVIPQYATVQVIQTGTKWCYVSYNGRTGYVMTKFLKIY